MTISSIQKKLNINCFNLKASLSMNAYIPVLLIVLFQFFDHNPSDRNNCFGLLHIYLGISSIQKIFSINLFNMKSPLSIKACLPVPFTVILHFFDHLPSNRNNYLGLQHIKMTILSVQKGSISTSSI